MAYQHGSIGPLVTALSLITDMEEGAKNKKTIFIGGIGEDVDEEVILGEFSTFGGSCWQHCLRWVDPSLSRRYHRRSTPYKCNRQAA